MLVCDQLQIQKIHLFSSDDRTSVIYNPSPPGVHQPLANFCGGPYSKRCVKIITLSPHMSCLCDRQREREHRVHLTLAMSCVIKSKLEIDVQLEN